MEAIPNTTAGPSTSQAAANPQDGAAHKPGWSSGKGSWCDTDQAATTVPPTE
jgi:hypothetical protein